MPKIAEEPLASIQLRLYETDLVKLRQLYGPNVGVNKAIRLIIRTTLRQIEAKADAKINANEKPHLVAFDDPPLAVDDGFQGAVL